MSSGLVPRGGTRDEQDIMLGVRSSSETDVEDRLLPGSADYGEKRQYKRHAGRKKTFRWIMATICVSILTLIPFIFAQFFNVQAKDGLAEPAHDEDNHEESPPPPSPADQVPELTTTITPTSTSSLVPTQIPQVKLTSDQRFNLQTGFKVSNVTLLREYVFNITRQQHSPDGYEKSMILVNRQSPGPLMEANTGNTIRVTLHNQMLQESTMIHWHGIDQSKSVWMDGVFGISQCAIPASESFTYEFNYFGPAGNFLIIHDPDGKIPLVGDDKIIMVGDVFHEYGGTYPSANPPWASKRPAREPPPDNVIINGRNTFNNPSIEGGDASKAEFGEDHSSHNMENMGSPNTPRDGPPPKCTWGSLFNKRVKSGSTPRLRLINHGASEPVLVTVDNCPLQIVEIDGVEIAPIATSRVYMNPGQRQSALVIANQTAGNYVIRADAAVRCFHMSHKNHNSGMMHATPFGAAAILSYDEADVGVPPIGKAWDLSSSSNPGIGKEPWGDRCEDLPHNLPKPVGSRPAYDVGYRNYHYFAFKQERVSEVVRTHVIDGGITPENLNSPQSKLDFVKDQFVLVSRDDKAAQIVVNSDAMMLATMLGTLDGTGDAGARKKEFCPVTKAQTGAPLAQPVQTGAPKPPRSL
ncbi:multicopper oxidase [Colletotrichum orchidophilum]|uniref:Multicopper oxidase n=1 Tax=Colletotrichum orchidophilum TaxID=1209926 RepID=A0A1G4AQG7_9PEZI|nr:multicopper oxidase [Colletotrichum orchidophilum]OHE91418.1 multicopper oxidase [Colletotrichum orchidophilum]